MKINIEIRLGDDAMRTPRDVARLLQNMAKAFLARNLGDEDEEIDEDWDGASEAFRDANGNRVATLEITP